MLIFLANQRAPFAPATDGVDCNRACSRILSLRPCSCVDQVLVEPCVRHRYFAACLGRTSTTGSIPPSSRATRHAALLRRLPVAADTIACALFCDAPFTGQRFEHSPGASSVCNDMEVQVSDVLFERSVGIHAIGDQMAIGDYASHQCHAAHDIAFIALGNTADVAYVPSREEYIMMTMARRWMLDRDARITLRYQQRYGRRKFLNADGCHQPGNIAQPKARGVTLSDIEQGTRLRIREKPRSSTDSDHQKQYIAQPGFHLNV